MKFMKSANTARHLTAQLVGVATIAAVLTLLSGCSALSDLLKPDPTGGDPDEQPVAQSTPQSSPTIGGRWSERGFLDDNGSGFKTAERGPSSIPAPYNTDSQQDRSTAARDNGSPSPASPSYENTPNLAPPTKRLYKNGMRATRADFIDDSQNEGSLWGSDGQTNYYFTKNKVRGVGDIITVTIEEGLVKDIGTEVKRTLDSNEKEAELALARQRAAARTAGTDKNKDAVSTSQAAPEPAAPGNGGSNPSGTNAFAWPQVTPADIDVAKSIELKPGDAVMAEIVERYPNGNYKISGTKRVIYKNGSPRLVNLVGVVRGSDIGDNDTVASGKLYEYRLEAVR
ncbi:MAG: flagellar basal body L-ring protein FlgH [Oligoflexia bacterium]|nr:flagellar basal body L-ring protein FlgH [Oligoflexia bacterium]